MVWRSAAKEGKGVSSSKLVSFVFLLLTPNGLIDLPPRCRPLLSLENRLWTVSLFPFNWNFGGDIGDSRFKAVHKS